MMKVKRYKLIACEIMFRELCFCAAASRNIIDPVFMPKGLHDMGAAKMSAKLQEEIDRIETAKYDAILLGYGLCNNGVIGLSAALPLVIPRAHDCITMLLGSKEKYLDYHRDNPGTFFLSPGWMERDEGCMGNDQNIMGQLGLNKTYQEYVAKYGEENARYLMETMGDWLKNYNKYAYIENGIGDFAGYKEKAREEATQKGWAFEELPGDVSLLLAMLNGDWDEERFLVVPPGQKPVPSYDERVITSASS